MAVKRKRVNGRLMYLGLCGDLMSPRHKYVQLNDDNTVREEWTFDTKIFKKTKMGMIFDCQFAEDNKSVFYNISREGTTLIKDEGETRWKATSLYFAELHNRSQIENRLHLQYRKEKSIPNEFDEILKRLNVVYHDLHSSSKPAFVAYCMNKIMK